MQQPEADIKNLCVWTSSEHDPSLQEWLADRRKFSFDSQSGDDALVGNRKKKRPFWSTKKVAKGPRGVNHANQGMNTAAVR